jgi:hypothetical protein
MFSVRAVYVLGPLQIVIVGLDADLPPAQRQTRLAALKSLDLTFFVITEHHCLLGRIEVKTDDIPKFRLKVRIGGKLSRPFWPFRFPGLRSGVDLTLGRLSSF